MKTVIYDSSIRKEVLEAIGCAGSNCDFCGTPLIKSVGILSKDVKCCKDILCIMEALDAIKESEDE